MCSSILGKSISCHRLKQVIPSGSILMWKSLRSHDYAMGLEPSNNNIMGRVNERANGTLPKLPAYGQEQFQVTIGVLEGAEEIAAFEKMVQAL